MTVHRYCVKKLGVHKGALAAARVAQYAMTTADLGHVPSNTEYCSWWVITTRTGFHHRALIKAAFGEDWRPVVEQLAAEIVRRGNRSPGVIKSMPLSLPA